MLVVSHAKISRVIEACFISHDAGTPAGVRFHFRILTGGVASLNPRLIAATPAGVEMKIGTQWCAVEQQTRLPFSISF